MNYEEIYIKGPLEREIMQSIYVEPLGMNDLTNMLDRGKPFLSQKLNQLIAKGFLRKGDRDGAPKDRGFPESLYHITDAGIAAVRRLPS